MPLPNSRNTNYQAAGGEIKSKDLDDLQDGLIAFTGRRISYAGAVSMSGLYPGGGCYSPGYNAFIWSDVSLSAGIKFAWGPRAPWGPGVAGPTLSGATQLTTLAHPDPDSRTVLFCRNSGSATTSNRLCALTNGQDIFSVTAPVSSTARPLLWWTGTKFWGTFDDHSTYYRSSTGVSGWGSALTYSGSLPENFAVGLVTVGSSTFPRAVFCTNQGATATGYTDDDGTTWNAETLHGGTANGIAWTKGVGFLIVGALSGAPRARVSVDGANWATKTVKIHGFVQGGPVSPTNLTGLVESGGRFVARLETDFSGHTGPAFTVMSIDGENWFVIDFITTATQLVPMIGGGNAFVLADTSNASFYV